ncbi:MAG: DUF3592 domain-containing protein [Polyangiaceae bacterium]
MTPSPTGYIGRRIELAAPPRPVSFGARMAMMFGGLRQVGWAGLLVFSLPMYVFVVDSELLSLIEFRGKLDSATGEVHYVKRTYSQDNNRQVMQVDYTYKVDDQEYRARSYAVDRWPVPGATVTVQYRADRPSSSRIEGLRARTFGVWSGLLFLPFLVLVGVSIVNAIRGAGDAKLLERGVLGFAKLVKKEPTNTRVNKQRVYRYVFELDLPPEEGDTSYRASSRSVERKYQFTVKTHKGRAIEDEPFEPVLYDPTRAGRGLALDALAVTISPEGGFDEGSGVVYLLLPLLCLASTIGVLAFIVAAI